jgi:broad specificity phosphatase PhoE
VSIALLVRHGKGSAFTSTAAYDNLSPPGIEQSEQLGEWLAEQALRVDAVFVGPRKRHVQTLDAVLRVLAPRKMTLPPATSMPELDEHGGISLVFKVLPTLAGDDDPELKPILDRIAATGKQTVEDVLGAFKPIARRWVRGEIDHHEVEPWVAFRARVSRAMARLASLGRGKTALVFTSGGTVAAAIAEALDIRDEERVLDLSWSLHNASISEFDFTGERWAMRSFNTIPHLRDKRLITGV